MTIHDDDVHVEDIPTDPRARREWNRTYREQVLNHGRLTDLEAHLAALEAKADRLEATMAEILAMLVEENGPVES